MRFARSRPVLPLDDRLWALGVMFLLSCLPARLFSFFVTCHRRESRDKELSESQGIAANLSISRTKRTWPTKTRTHSHASWKAQHLLSSCQFNRDLPCSNQKSEREPRHGNRTRVDTLVESGSLRIVIADVESPNVLDSRQSKAWQLYPKALAHRTGSWRQVCGCKWTKPGTEKQ